MYYTCKADPYKANASVITMFLSVAFCDNLEVVCSVMAPPFRRVVTLLKTAFVIKNVLAYYAVNWKAPCTPLLLMS